jgi:leucyl/phenylalanyl-tRNA---protein transferase
VPIEPPPTPWLFADPDDDRYDDLVGLGADLEPGTLLAAYRRGLFPMPGDRPRDPLLWFSPVHRGVLPLGRTGGAGPESERGGMKVSKSLRRSLRDFEIRVDTAFDEVVAACGDPARPQGWIDDRIRAAYGELHRLGWAHSIETWREGRLAGGLYGVAIGGLFAGESMFHRETDASKVALVGLVDLLNDEYAEARLLDVQWSTPHLASLGVVEIDRGDYLARLRDALTVPLPDVFV